jgi:hypothetical protein
MHASLPKKVQACGIFAQLAIISMFAECELISYQEMLFNSRIKPVVVGNGGVMDAYGHHRKTQCRAEVSWQRRRQKSTVEISHI